MALHRTYGAWALALGLLAGCGQPASAPPGAQGPRHGVVGSHVAPVVSSVSGPELVTQVPSNPVQPDLPHLPLDAKLDARFALHRQAKLQLSGAPPTVRARALSLQGLRANADAETAAIYVKQRWTAAEQQAWARFGVEVNPDLWIPPVPDHRHLWGFHVAVVPYAQLARLTADPNVVRIRSLEVPALPLNDLGRTAIKADLVQAGPPAQIGRAHV